MPAGKKPKNKPKIAGGAYMSCKPALVFPSGFCSKWQKMQPAIY